MVKKCRGWQKNLPISWNGIVIDETALIGAVVGSLHLLLI